MRRLIYILGVFSTIFVHAKTIYLVPVGGHNATRVFYDPSSERDEVAKPFFMVREGLEKMGYTVKFTYYGEDIEDATAVISFSEINPRLLDNLCKIPRERSLLFVFEPPVVVPKFYNELLTGIFGRIFVMLDDIVDNQDYFKLYYPQPYQKVLKPIPDFSERKLCVFIAGNKSSSQPNELYTERRRMISFFKEKHPEDFDLYGTDWDQYGAHPVRNKWEVIKNYKFCFCYENMNNQRGYITEKIFDALTGGAVPIYLGADNIEDYVPKSCFVDRRDFSTYDELYAYLKGMDRATYESYLQAIQEYFKTPQAQLFSCEHFVQTIIDHIEEIDTQDN